MRSLLAQDDWPPARFTSTRSTRTTSWSPSMRMLVAVHGRGRDEGIRVHDRSSVLLIDMRLSCRMTKRLQLPHCPDHNAPTPAPTSPGGSGLICSSVAKLFISLQLFSACRGHVASTSRPQRAAAHAQSITRGEKSAAEPVRQCRCRLCWLAASPPWGLPNRPSWNTSRSSRRLKSVKRRDRSRRGTRIDHRQVCRSARRCQRRRRDCQRQSRLRGRRCHRRRIAVAIGRSSERGIAGVQNSGRSRPHVRFHSPPMMRRCRS
jgi:hypothetical protein